MSWVGLPITIFPAYPIERLYYNTRLGLRFFTDGLGFSVGSAHTLTTQNFS